MANPESDYDVTETLLNDPEVQAVTFERAVKPEDRLPALVEVALEDLRDTDPVLARWASDNPGIARAATKQVLSSCLHLSASLQDEQVRTRLGFIRLGKERAVEALRLSVHPLEVLKLKYSK